MPGCLRGGGTELQDAPIGVVAGEQRCEGVEGHRAVRVVGVLRVAGPAQPDTAPAVAGRRPSRIRRRAQIGDAGGDGVHSRAEQVRQAHQGDVGVDGRQWRAGREQGRPAVQRFEQAGQLGVALDDNVRLARVQQRGVARELDGVAETLFRQQQEPPPVWIAALPKRRIMRRRRMIVRLPAPFVFREAGRQIAGQQQGHGAVPMHLRVVRCERSGAVVRCESVVQPQLVLPRVAEIAPRARVFGGHGGGVLETAGGIAGAPPFLQHRAERALRLGIAGFEGGGAPQDFHRRFQIAPRRAGEAQIGQRFGGVRFACQRRLVAGDRAVQIPGLLQTGPEADADVDVAGFDFQQAAVGRHGVRRPAGLAEGVGQHRQATGRIVERASFQRFQRRAGIAGLAQGERPLDGDVAIVRRQRRRLGQRRRRGGRVAGNA